MGNLKNLFEDSKKLAKLDKRTIKSLLKTINDLDYDKKMTLIIFFTEFEPKTKEYRKFWRITKEKYAVEDIFKASCFLNLYKICPRKEVIKTLSQSKKGLEVIAKIFQNYNFLTENENLKLLNLCLENAVKNIYLEKFTKKMVYKSELIDTLVLLNKIETVDENILQSCTSGIILEYLKSKSFKDFKSAKNVLLVRNLVYLLFEEKNYEFLTNFLKENKEILIDIFGKNETSLKGLACKAYLFGNNETDLHVLRILANNLDKSTEDIIKNKKILQLFKYPKLTYENTLKYLKDNLWVSSFVSNFFYILKEYLPDNIISLLLHEEIKNYKDFYCLIDSLAYKNKDKLIYKESFFEVAMKSVKFKNYMINNGFTYLEGEDMVRFISKWTKREDFEFYLSYLVNYKKISAYEKYLKIYRLNRIYKDKTTKHMRIYNHINSLRGYINEGKLAVEHKVIEMHCNGLFKALESFDIESCFNNIIGISLLCVIIDFLITISDIMPHLRDQIFGFYDEVLNLNKVKKNDEINYKLWMSLQNTPEIFVERIDDFYKFEDEIIGNAIKNRKFDGKLEAFEKYEGSTLSTIVVDYIAKNYTLQEVLDTLLSKYEDERDFYYEILLKKSKNQEYDARIFTLNDSPWLDKIFNEIFVIEKNEIFEMLQTSKPEFLFDYSIRHKTMRKKYFDKIDKQNCTITTAIEIYKIIEIDQIKERNGLTFIDDIYGDKATGNLEYQCAVSFFDDLDLLTEDKLRLIYLLSYIRPVDSKFLLFKYFNLITKEVIHMKKHQTKDEEETKNMIDFILSVHLSDKFFVFTAMNELIDCMKNATQTGKYLVLKNFDSKNVTKMHIANYLDVITSLLHDTNVNICNEAKRLLNNVSFISPEMLSLRSQVIQCLIDKMYVKPFFETLFVQVFNHYICVNSLTLLVQILRTYIKDYKEDVLFIIEHLYSIVKPSDFTFIMPSIFNILSKFVVDNQFFTDEVIKTSTICLEHSKNIDFTLLVDNIDKSLSVGALLVKTLKMCDTKVQREATGRIISSNDETINIPNNFLAYAPELTVFQEYLTHFIPILKDMYESDDYDKRKIAFNAFERIIIDDYIIQTALIGMWAIRLNSLDLFMKKNSFGDKELACIFILRHDPHSIVRKKAYELWKLNVDNPNKKLKDIYFIIFEYIRYINNSNSLRDSVKNTISEIVTKYVKYCEIYMREYFIDGELFNFCDKEEKIMKTFNYEFDESLCKLPYIDVIEIILLECAKSNKLLDLVYKFASQYVSVMIYKTLLQNVEYKERIIELVKKNIQDTRLKELFEDVSLSQELYNMTGDKLLLDNMKDIDRFKLLKNNLNDYERVKDIFQVSVASHDLEVFILERDVEIQYLYLNYICQLENFGNLKKIFSAVFIKKKDAELQDLVTKKNTKYILEVTYKNIVNYDKIVCLIIQTNTLIAIERLDEIIDYLDELYFGRISKCKCFANEPEKTNLQAIIGYLFYNFLFYENRTSVKTCMKKLMRRVDLSDYDKMIKRTILK